MGVAMIDPQRIHEPPTQRLCQTTPHRAVRDINLHQKATWPNAFFMIIMKLASTFSLAKMGGRGVNVSTASRVIYLLVGLLIFVVCGWLTAVAVPTLANDPNHSLLGIPTGVWIGTLGSISASGIFFSVSETLRWAFDRSIARNYERLRFYEDTVGIKDYFSQKGSEEANKDYGDAIASAKTRVWAFGISNGEFISSHLSELINKKKKFPQLDVCICFIDPNTKIILTNGSQNTTISQIQLYDTTRDLGLVTDNSSRVDGRIQNAVDMIANASIDISIRLVSTAGYVSAMVVDDIIYVFPFTAVSKDNTRTPYLKVSVTSAIGQAFFEFFENIKDHPTLSKPPK